MEDLIKQLKNENNKDKLSNILEVIERKGLEDCAPILPFLSDRRYQVRHSAIKALRKCNGIKIEEALIQVLLHPIDMDDLIYANGVLSEIGTANAIPFLINLLDHHKDDVKGSALYALSEIGGNELLPVFIKALTEGTFGLKSCATSAIHRHGDETAVNAVIARVKTILKRKRKRGSDELILAIDFLNKFRENNPQIKELFNWIKVKRRDYLFREEEFWMEVNIDI